MGSTLKIGMVAMGLMAGCTNAAPPPSAGPPATAVPPAATLQGTLGGRPFIGRTALLVGANEPFTTCWSKDGNGCSTAETPIAIEISTLHIFERPVTCADRGSIWGPNVVPLASGEHMVELRLEGHWPVFPGSLWQTGGGGASSREELDATFRSSAGSGSIAGGPVTFDQATGVGGVVTVNLTSLNPQGKVAGQVAGSIPFEVCR